MAVEQLGKFLCGDDLGTRMRKVATGTNLRCAVAFWTQKGVAELFPEGLPDDAQIVCDISMGSTSPEALQDLGAPHNDQLKHALSMHAKVILSDHGLVVGSANATGAAIGASASRGRNVEAGTFHDTGSEPWRKAASWFEKLFRQANPVRQSEINWAEILSRRQQPPMLRPPAAGSLLELVRAAPDRFASVGFVFTKTETKPEVRKRIIDAVSANDPTIHKRLGKSLEEGIFAGWKRHEVEQWPGFFFEFWQPPRQELTIYGRRLEARVASERGVLGVEDWMGVSEQIGITLPTSEDIESVDRALALQVSENADRIFNSGLALAKWMAERELGQQG